MSEWIRSALDILLVVLVGGGLVQASRLIKHLAELRASRVEMEVMVRDFNSAVTRAETGIKNLRHAARESGDDLERLVDKALMVRDELHFIVESADQLASRLSQTASSIIRPEAPAPVQASASPAAEAPKLASVTPIPSRKPEPVSVPASRAEKELLQALQKLS